MFEADPKQIIEYLNMEIYKRERIIQNYDLLIQQLNQEVANNDTKKDKVIAKLQKDLSNYIAEEQGMMARRAFLKMFLKEKYNASIEDLDEFVTEKRFENRNKNAPKPKRKKD
jgi:hypothetical protein